MSPSNRLVAWRLRGQHRSASLVQSQAGGWWFVYLRVEPSTVFEGNAQLKSEAVDQALALAAAGGEP